MSASASATGMPRPVSRLHRSAGTRAASMRARARGERGRQAIGRRPTCSHPIFRYPGRLWSLGVLKTKWTPSSRTDSRACIVRRVKIPRPWYSGCVAVSTARTARRTSPPTTNSQRMNTRTPAMRPSFSGSTITHAGEAPKTFSSCFQR